ncbi:MAG: hydantoinase/oxoprolinase N-terminal domain-containing protein, partial [Exilibacterium sp.]
MTGQEQTNELTKWQFWVDRGGTFTDIVARSPDGGLLTKKLLSENPNIYSDAALHGIREFLNLNPQDPIPFQRIESVKMGTTVATNALLERKGTPTVLAITRGLGDVLEIGYQERPETFALNIKKTELLYTRVVEIAERVRADGSVPQPLDITNTFDGLKNAYNAGYRSIAIVLMHAYRYPEHEKIVEDIARKIGFQQISCSHTVSPLTRIVSRGDTTVVDAYLT